MIQEIITYIIVAAAVVFAFLKVFKKPGKKRNPSVSKNLQKEKFTMQHNCDDCSAECMLRNASKPMLEKNKDLCREIELKQKL